MFLSAGFNRSYQNIHLATNNNLGLPNDVWLPATDKLVPGRATQFMAGVGGQLPRWGVNWGVEAFQKNMANQIDYREGINPLLNTATNWEDMLITGGTGVSKGVELSLARNSGRLTGLLAYAYSKTTRQFDDINNGVPYRFNYDYPHLLNGTVNYDNKRKWNFSGTLAFRSGQPFSFPEFALESPFDGASNPLYFYNKRNNIRLPYYLRVDLGANKQVTTRNGRAATWSFSIYNVLNRKNILYAQVGSYLTGYQNGQPIYQSRLSLKPFLPILPAVSYAVKF